MQSRRQGPGVRSELRLALSRLLGESSVERPDEGDSVACGLGLSWTVHTNSTPAPTEPWTLPDGYTP